MFAVLLAGIYSAYKHFSGLDPLKLDREAIFRNLDLTSVKIDPKALGKSVQTKVISKPENTTKSAISKPIFRFLLLSDSHNDNLNLEKAINQAKGEFPGLEFIIGLGDYTEVGTIPELKNAKAVLDSSAVRYFLLPGDHDLWDCRNRGVSAPACFNEVFGPTYQSFTFKNYQFLLLNNSDNYQGIDQQQSKWIIDELEKTKKGGIKGVFVFIHEPLFHPSSDHVMGRVEKDLKLQAEELIFRLKQSGVVMVFAGDIHYFSEYLEPKTNLAMVTIGALSIERNPQAPRFAVVSVFEDGTTKVEDMQIR